MIDFYLLNNSAKKEAEYNLFFDLIAAGKLTILKDELLATAEQAYQYNYKNLSVERKIILLDRLAYTRIQTRHYDVAAKYISKGIQLYYKNDLSSTVLAQFLILNGMLYRRNSKFDKALECYLKAIFHDPENVYYYIQAGATFCEVDKFLEAEENFEKAKELIDEHERIVGTLNFDYKQYKYQIFLNYGFMFGKRQYHKKAAQNFEFAISFAISNSLNHKGINFGINMFNLAYSYLRDKNIKQSYVKFLESYEYNLKEENYNAIALSCLRITEILSNYPQEISNQNEPDKDMVIKFATLAEKYAAKNKVHGTTKLILIENAKTYKKFGMLEKMINCYEDLHEINESKILMLEQSAIDEVSENLKDEIKIQKIKNKKIVDQKKELIKTNSMLKKVNSIIAHDIKEPFRSINYRLDKLDKQLKFEFNRTEINGIKESMNVIGTIIDDIINMSKITNVKINNTEKVDLNKSISVVKSLLNKKISNTNAVIKYKNLPVVIARNGLIVQLFQNLIANAINYNTSDIPEIEIVFEKFEEHFLIKVRDNGIGIPKENVNEIFNQFTRFNNGNKSDGNIGLGLFISKNIVQLLGGTISVESTPSLGSTFIINFPIKLLVD